MEENGCKHSCDSVPEIDEQEVGFSGIGPIVDCKIDDDSDEPDYSEYTLKRPKKRDNLKKKKKKLAYGFGPDVDCEIDDDSDEPDYSKYLPLKRPKKRDYHQKKKKCLTYGVGPDVDCKFDDDNNKPDSSYAVVPKENLVNHRSTSRYHNIL